LESLIRILTEKGMIHRVHRDHRGKTKVFNHGATKARSFLRESTELGLQTSLETLEENQL
jgi:hypothetical protein